MGGTIEAESDDQRTPAFDAPLAQRWKAMWWGVNVPWNLLVSAGIGLWLMFAPAILGNGARVADSDHLVGALITPFAVIAMAEVARPLRLLNIAFGSWLVVAPWLLSGVSPAGGWFERKDRTETGEVTHGSTKYWGSAFDARGVALFQHTLGHLRHREPRLSCARPKRSWQTVKAGWTFAKMGVPSNTMRGTSRGAIRSA